MEEFTNVHFVALLGFGIAVVFGAVANKTNFCVMGSISDTVLMGSKGRLGAWLVAMGIAMVGTQVLQLAGLIDVGESRYLTSNFAWLSYIVGGLLFGIGMTLGAGCGQRNLVRLGSGNLKALVVLLVMGVTAYMTIRGLLGLVRTNSVEAANVELSEFGLADQGLVTLVQSWSGIETGTIPRVVLMVLLGAGFIVYALRQRPFRESFDNILAGVVIGVCIVAGWLATGYLGVDDFDPVPVESLSFIAATGNTVNYFMTFTGSTINFGIAVVLGMVIGSFVYGALSKSLRLETFSDRADMIRHLVGGAFMGFGGVLALGCTVGQGISGMSTLAIGSILATVSIVFGSVLTLKVEYYLLDEIGFRRAVGAALSDLFLPGRGEEA